jgi:K+-transporting ATPase ATPase B chain
VEEVSSLGGTPLVVCENNKILGVIYLKDTVKPGMVERFERLRAIGIKTIMCTGDNPLTAATIAKDADGIYTLTVEGNGAVYTKANE